MLMKKVQDLPQFLMNLYNNTLAIFTKAMKSLHIMGVEGHVPQTLAKRGQNLKNSY